MTTATTKFCPKCQADKPVSDFRRMLAASDGLQYACSLCQDEARRERIAANPNYYRGKRLVRLFGLSWEVYEAMLEAQDGVCAICKQPETATHRTSGEVRLLSVDHDHETDEVRGLLCQRCNSALGMFLDDIEVVMNAVTYLNGNL